MRHRRMMQSAAWGGPIQNNSGLLQGPVGQVVASWGVPAEPLGAARSFKGMASTRLNEMGCWHPDAIEPQLAHQESDDGWRAYLHAVEYWPGPVRMMQAWADYLDELRDAGKGRPVATRECLREMTN
jgi:hypothetical protein